MKSNFEIINQISTNIEIFESNKVLPRYLVGYSNKELGNLLDLYKLTPPLILCDFLNLGGHNFIQMFHVEYICAYTYLLRLKRDDTTWQKYFQNEHLIIDNVFILAVHYDANAYIFLDLQQGNVSPVYHIFRDDTFQLTCEVLYENMQKMLEKCYAKQQSDYYEYLKIKNKAYYYNYFNHPKFIEEVEKQYDNYKKGENWSEYYAIAEKNYNEWFEAPMEEETDFSENEANIVVNDEKVDDSVNESNEASEIDNDLPF